MLVALTEVVDMVRGVCSAAVIIGNGKLALVTAGTDESSWGYVKFGEVLSLY